MVPPSFSLSFCGSWLALSLFSFLHFLTFLPLALFLFHLQNWHPLISLLSSPPCLRPWVNYILWLKSQLSSVPSTLPEARRGFNAFSKSFSQVPSSVFPHIKGLSRAIFLFILFFFLPCFVLFCSLSACGRLRTSAVWWERLIIWRQGSNKGEWPE